MQVNSEEDQVDIRVQEQCTISCISFRVVQMVHAISWGPMDELRSYGKRISQLNMG